MEANLGGNVGGSELFSPGSLQCQHLPLRQPVHSPWPQLLLTKLDACSGLYVWGEGRKGTLWEEGGQDQQPAIAW